MPNDKLWADLVAIKKRMVFYNPAGLKPNERHFASSEAVRDIVIGMSDGLTVPFALAAGLSGRLESSSLIVVAGLAEIVAGAIAMGLGGYLAASSDTEHYVTERAREEREVHDIPSAEAAELTTVLTSYGAPRRAHRSSRRCANGRKPGSTS